MTNSIQKWGWRADFLNKICRDQSHSTVDRLLALHGFDPLALHDPYQEWCLNTEPKVSFEHQWMWPPKPKSIYKWPKGIWKKCSESLIISKIHIKSMMKSYSWEKLAQITKNENSWCECVGGRVLILSLLGGMWMVQFVGKTIWALLKNLRIEHSIWFNMIQQFHFLASTERAQNPV